MDYAKHDTLTRSFKAPCLPMILLIILVIYLRQCAKEEKLYDVHKLVRRRAINLHTNLPDRGVHFLLKLSGQMWNV